MSSKVEECDETLDIFLALIPIISIVLLLFVFHMSSPKAGVIAFFITIVTVYIYAPATKVSDIALASLHGMLISLVIIYVLFFGILLFHLLNEITFIEKISDFVSNTTMNPTRQVIMLAIAFSPLIESVSGFGIGIIVIAPILVALGFDRYKAALISLLSLSAVPWGALATGTVIGSNVTNIPIQQIGVGSAYLSIPTFLFFAFIAIYVVSGKKGILESWLEILIVSLALAIGIIISNQWFSVELAGVIGAIVALVAEGICIYFSQKEKSFVQMIKENLFIVKVLTPYLFLTVLLIVTRIPTLESALTSFGVIRWERYAFSLPVFYSPGFFLLLTSLFAFFIYKMDWPALKRALKTTTNQLIPVAVTTIAFIALAQIMAEVNLMQVLAEGIGTAVGPAFLWIAPIIGAFSGLITGSNAASNAMFIELQTMTASKYNISTSLVASIQNTSASHMTMASPSRVLLAATITGSKDKEKKLFKTTALIVGIALVLMMLASFVFVHFTTLF